MAAKRDPDGNGMPARARMRLTQRQAMAIAVEALCDAKTVHRWAAGDTTVRETTDIRIQRAIAKLGIREAT